MNKIILIGRLTKDPEMREIEITGRVFCKFTLAVDRKYKSSDGDKQVDFIPVVFWGKKAEVIGKYLTKGQLLSISGSLQTGHYETSDGVKHYRAEVVAEDFQFVERKKEAI